MSPSWPQGHGKYSKDTRGSSWPLCWVIKSFVSDPVSMKHQQANLLACKGKLPNPAQVLTLGSYVFFYKYLHTLTQINYLQRLFTQCSTSWFSLAIKLYRDQRMSACACLLQVALTKTLYRVVLDLRNNRLNKEHVRICVLNRDTSVIP